MLGRQFPQSCFMTSFCTWVEEHQLVLVSEHRAAHLRSLYNNRISKRTDDRAVVCYSSSCAILLCISRVYPDKKKHQQHPCLVKNLGNVMRWSSCRCTCHHTALSESLSLALAVVYLLRRNTTFDFKLKGEWNRTTKCFSSCSFGIVQQGQWFPDLSCN